MIWFLCVFSVVFPATCQLRSKATSALKHGLVLMSELLAESAISATWARASVPKLAEEI